jgi:signal transduction histidine kinase
MDNGATQSSLENTISFDQILTATVRMIRSSWKASVCLFMQTDDQGGVRIRACDGVAVKPGPESFCKSGQGTIGECLGKGEIVEVSTFAANDPLHALLSPYLTVRGYRFVLVPVTGEARALGLLVIGPFSGDQDIRSRDGELRSAGALCAVLSAHWRLYEWMSHFLPQMNHQIRTPLTAVQGSLGMVLGGMFGQLGSEVREMLEMAQKGCERTVRAMEEYLNRETPPSK